MNKKIMTLCCVLIFIFTSFGSLYLTFGITSLFQGGGFPSYRVSPFFIISILQTNSFALNLYLICLGFCLILVAIFITSNMRPYYSDLKKITPNIETPVVAGQNQHDSASWLDEREIDRTFKSLNINTQDKVISKLIESGLKESKAIDKGELWTDQNKYDFEFGQAGMVIGKKDKRNSEQVYFIDKDIHSMLIGSTRCGKTRTCVLQTIGSLALAGESIITCDPKGELCNYTQPFLEKLNYDVFRLDFKNPLKSDRYNFLQPVIDAVNNDDIPTAIQDTWNIVASLVGEPKGERIWNDGECSVIASCIMIVVIENKNRPQFQNMTNVYFFISEMCKTPSRGQPLINYFLADLRLRDHNHPAIGLLGAAEIAPDKTRGSFYTSALMTLKLFTNPRLYSMTCQSDFKPVQCGQKKTAIFMILPDHQSTYYPIAAFYTKQQYESLVVLADSMGGRLPRRTNFVLDEFGNFTAIPDFEAQLTVGGGRGIRFNLFLQSFSQLEKKYEKVGAENIKDNCETWIYLQATNPETLKIVSEKLGNYTTTAYSLSSSNHKTTESNLSHSINLLSRPLLTPYEVGRIERPYSLVTGRNKPVIMKSPDLSQWHFNKMFGLGNEEHNIEVRRIREEGRAARQDVEMEIWRIWDEYLKLDYA